ncbi:alpha/beta hydrolase [Amycolatopsis sacchari]|uniref:Alpha/beta hydrolase n=1 Tax=Amycolatopsis sacchari TaxID=115433 RepID=A0A1I3LUB5_9PSEU|nr:alpha/beta hydrolase [Amycolatopsis sacchari]SFI88130.1 Alpha/beta hydrolase [Amycolatopsis sacchari]
MVSWGEVIRWSPEPLAELVAVLNDRYNRLVGCADELRATAMPEGWAGPAANAAATEAARLAAAAEELAAEGAAVRRAAGDVSDAITGLLHGVAEARSLAAAHEFVIGDDGRVTDHGPPPVCTAQDPDGSLGRAHRQRIAVELQDRVREVLRSAEDVDNDFCAVLDRVLAGHVIDPGDDRTDLAAAGNSGWVLGSLSIPAPTIGATPADNAAWWATLSPNQQAVLLRDHPELLGNRDGLPGEVRSRANLARIPAERAAIQQRIDAAAQELAGLSSQSEVSPGAIQWVQDEIDRLEAKLGSLNAVEATMRRPGERQLLTLDTSGDRVKAALAVGNVDTAEHVAVFTPGFTSTVDRSLSGYDNDMQNLQQHSQSLADRYGDGGQVATVRWMGYEAPQWSGVLDGNQSVISDHLARVGAEKLDGFLDGLGAAHSSTGNPLHLTALGHSYGSLTTGIALQEDTPVDDAVVFGSPGLDADERDDLKVPDGHLFAARSDQDSVPGLDMLDHFGVSP